MSRPSISDIRIARAVAQRVLSGETIHPDELQFMTRTLYAATKPPTDQEVANLYATEAYESVGDAQGIALAAMWTVPESSAARTLATVRRLFGAP
jgi:hypothetical protein